MATPVPLSAYEQERARKIERNNALLRKLGLITDHGDPRGHLPTSWQRRLPLEAFDGWVPPTRLPCCCSRCDSARVRIHNDNKRVLWRVFLGACGNVFCGSNNRRERAIMLLLLVFRRDRNPPAIRLWLHWKAEWE
jgi:hypothetical protein